MGKSERKQPQFIVNWMYVEKRNLELDNRWFDLKCILGKSHKT